MNHLGDHKRVYIVAAVLCEIGSGVVEAIATKAGP